MCIDRSSGLNNRRPRLAFLFPSALKRVRAPALQKAPASLGFPLFQLVSKPWPNAGSEYFYRLLELQHHDLRL